MAARRSARALPRADLCQRVCLNLWRSWLYDRVPARPRYTLYSVPRALQWRQGEVGRRWCGVVAAVVVMAKPTPTSKHTPTSNKQAAAASRLRCCQASLPLRPHHRRRHNQTATTTATIHCTAITLATGSRGAREKQPASVGAAANHPSSVWARHDSPGAGSGTTAGGSTHRGGSNGRRSSASERIHISCTQAPAACAGAPPPAAVWAR